MWNLSEHIMEYVQDLPEATQLCSRALFHLGNGVAMDKALPHLAQSGELLRNCQDVYMRPIKTLLGFWASRLRLTIQNPVAVVYLMFGPNCRIHARSSIAELRHASRGQLMAPHCMVRQHHPPPDKIWPARGQGRAGNNPCLSF